jgi:hypothetical protein
LQSLIDDWVVFSSKKISWKLRQASDGMLAMTFQNLFEDWFESLQQFMLLCRVDVLAAART